MRGTHPCPALGLVPGPAGPSSTLEAPGAASSSFDVASETTLPFAGNTYDGNGGTLLTGSGTVALTGGRVDVSAACP